MDTPDLDDEEKARRKRESVDWRNKNRFGNIFMFCASVFEIAVILLIMCVLFFATLLFMIKFCNLRTSATAQGTFQILSIVFFILGFIIGFKVYKKVVTWAIFKYGFDKKLPTHILDHYRKKSDVNQLGE